MCSTPFSFLYKPCSLLLAIVAVSAVMATSSQNGHVKSDVPSQWMIQYQLSDVPQLSNKTLCTCAKYDYDEVNVRCPLSEILILNAIFTPNATDTCQTDDDYKYTSVTHDVAMYCNTKSFCSIANFYSSFYHHDTDTCAVFEITWACYTTVTDTTMVMSAEAKKFIDYSKYLFEFVLVFAFIFTICFTIYIRQRLLKRLRKKSGSPNRILYLQNEANVANNNIAIISMSSQTQPPNYNNINELSYPSNGNESQSNPPDYSKCFVIINDEKSPESSTTKTESTQQQTIETSQTSSTDVDSEANSTQSSDNQIKGESSSPVELNDVCLRRQSNESEL